MACRERRSPNHSLLFKGRHDIARISEQLRNVNIVQAAAQGLDLWIDGIVIVKGRGQNVPNIC
jgi:hypothetical protein